MTINERGEGGRERDRQKGKEMGRVREREGRERRGRERNKGKEIGRWREGEREWKERGKEIRVGGGRRREIRLVEALDWLNDFIDTTRKGLIFSDNYKLLDELLYNINNIIYNYNIHEFNTHLKQQGLRYILKIILL